MNDPGNLLLPKERAIADYLAEHGARVDPRLRDPKATSPQPDTMVRWSGEDAGSITEFKTMERGSLNSMEQNLKGAKQSADKVVVADGRNVGLTRDVADKGWSNVVNRTDGTGASKPSVAYVLLGDGTMVVYRRVG